ncbi:MAG: hypothetical protein FWD46_09170, partial [Cystobacterineae bacterium]|nr:hypothetical protein [Cystobacterineae bacterium]
IAGNQNGAAGTCQDVAACRVGNDAACGGNGYACVGIAGNQNGAAGTCQDVAACRVGDNSCAAGYACVGTSSNQNGAAGTCVQNPVNPGQPWTKVEFTQADVNVLRLRKVFFGHNSVGQNTIDGMRRVASTISVRTANSSNLNSIIGQLSSSPAFVEYMTENNGNPLAKITVFENAMGIVGDRVDIAFMKFCYADFPTNVNTLITTYQSAMTRLQQRFPHVLFIHVTAPLYNFNASYDNSNREQFNAWLRDTYKGKVFDLATIESVRPNGTTVLSRDGKTIALADEWTSDGGHLNTEGANRMGGALIAFLASLQL